LVEKNITLAEKSFKENSIHLLYHVSSNLINRIALGDISTPSQANPRIKQMREIIVKFNGGDPRLLHNQFFF